MKYMDFNGLSHFLSKLPEMFSRKTHTHKKSDITDLVIDSSMSSTSSNPVQNKVVNSALTGKVSTSRKINGKPLSADITLVAGDVGADSTGTAATKANEALANAKTYTDTMLDSLIDSAPDGLDTLGKVATSVQQNTDNINALEVDIENKVDKVSGKGLSTNDYTTTEKNKLSGISSGAEVNQNAFSNITINTTNIAADSKTDTFTIVAGSNITLTPDTTNDKVTIAAKDTVYTHPTSGVTAGTYKSVTVNAAGHVTSGSNPTTLSGYGITDAATKSHSHDNASTSAAGFMSVDDKKKLDGIATGANKITVDSALSSTSTNPVQNKIVNTALDGKVPTSRTINGKALSGDITLSASDVGADASGTAESKANTALSSAKSYTDTKVAALVDSAPDTLNTLNELAVAIQENQDVTDALDAAISNKVDKVSGKGLSTNDYTTSEKNKLAAIASGAEVNQNAFSTITVGTTAIAADSKTDTFTITAGSNITLTPDATNDKMTIAATDTKYSAGSGLSLSGTTINHSNSVTAGTASEGGSARTLAFGGSFNVPSVTYDAQGHVTAKSSVALKVPNSTASTSADGLMSVADKVKLNGIAENANNYTHPTYTARTGVPTANATPGFGGTFSVSQPVSDGTGHITAVNSRTITIPSATATTSAAGLMSSTDKTKVDATNVAYGTCTTAAATAAKVITISGNSNWTLSAGSIIIIKFSYTNTASNPTFNVAGTGAKSVWYNTALITTSNLSYAGYAKRYGEYIYDGTQFVFIGWSVDSNTTYSNASLGQGYGTCATAAATAAKVVTLSSYSLTKGGVVSVKFTYGVPDGATMNINSKGAKAIYYRGAAITAGIIEAGDLATFIYDGTQYHLLTVDRHRFFSMLVPYGISIEEDEDLNSIEYMRVGNYYCSSNAKAATLANCPTETAFMLTVSSPLSTAIDNETTKTWIYRLRRLQLYTGDEYIQYCYVGATAGTWIYGEWKRVVLSDNTATTSAAGLMSAADKAKLDGVATGANAYTLPTASSSTLGGVKTTSTVTSTSGLTACPIIGGVPYYKDTNNTYSLSSFGITATAAELNKLDGVTATTAELNILDGITATTAELNYCDGVTSNIQTQLNGKAASSHGTHVSYGTSASALGTSSAGTATTVSRSDHVHALPALTSCTGTLSVAKGGTGATTAAAALTNLGAAAASHTHTGMYTTSNLTFVLDGTTLTITKS